MTYAYVTLASVLAAGPQAPGRFDLPLRSTMSQHEASMAMGYCALRNNRKAAEALVSARDKASLERAGRRIGPTLVTCLAGARSATLNMSSLRGGIAEAMVVSKDGRVIPAARGMSPTVPVRVEALDDDAGIATVMACAVAASPSAAVELLEAKAETAEEAAAFRKMVPGLQRCVPGSGAVRIKPMHIRGLTAVGLYQRTTEAPSGVSPAS